MTRRQLAIAVWLAWFEVKTRQFERAIEPPFKCYSDGMRARSIFLIATSVLPRVLMLDELLRAGDLHPGGAEGATDRAVLAGMMAQAGGVWGVAAGRRCLTF